MWRIEYYLQKQKKIKIKIKKDKNNLETDIHRKINNQNRVSGEEEYTGFYLRVVIRRAHIMDRLDSG
ncbi:hypothetical protein RIR_jg11830.t1 [Rhizophagus irregularis DAOM 181602=DAOM 197198]|uniref:Uncharacterized protein n=1 Tax=Rhizophagus irregularis (strain DAOM 181602 / DAOM 197198 / MUCL 43194) TaxID=747089 RepID=U9TWK6_RHIID|nr:hypothetical protein RIR_jg11830.t1 [Rhizophagus irregularis DAOM 181602=DAOM 197198]